MSGRFPPCRTCAGEGYRPLIGPLYLRCRACEGSGERPRLAWRIWTLLRHGAATREDY